MKESYPYEVAYDHFAHKIITHGLPPLDEEGSMPPFVALVSVKDGKTRRAEVLPVPPTMLAGQGEGLHHLVEETLAELANDDPEVATFCLVVGAEAIAVRHKKAERPAATQEALLAHPDAQHSIVLMVYRPEGVRMGLLPIDAQRQVAYAPLLAEDGAFMRVPNAPLH